MRQLDIHLKIRDAENVKRAIAAFDPVDWMTFPMEQQDRILIRVLMHDGRSQVLTDTIQDCLTDCRDWRITTLPVEATLPVPEPLKDDERQADLQVLREELLDDVTKDAALTSDFLLLSALSTVVAAIGLNSDGEAAVIGAMLIAPLLGPILGFSLGVGLGQYPLIKQSGWTLAAGIGVSLLVAYALSLVIGLNTESHQLMSRAEVRLDSIALALAAGGAAALSMAQGKSAVLAGVMVAAALLPPGAAFGLFIGAGEWTLASRSGLLLLMNIACLILSALIVFRLKNIRPRGWIDQKNADRAIWINAGLSVVFLAMVGVLIVVLDLGKAVDLGQ